MTSLSQQHISCSVWLIDDLFRLNHMNVEKFNVSFYQHKRFCIICEN